MASKNSQGGRLRPGKRNDYEVGQGRRILCRLENVKKNIDQDRVGSIGVGNQKMGEVL